ncbi:hypothetical protein [Kineothrix sedimenti]|uniref:Uncharacterized protein n=1 Tax=Kineothrix sedimenti TaxID=3123317 RepID=A0ABZ3EZX5_9FIRM
MITYIKSKLFYAKLKIEIFKAFSQSNAYIEMLTKLAIASKDMTAEEVKKEFLKELAGVIHDSVHKDDTKDTDKK